MTLEGVNMIIDNSILDELTAKAKENSRLRCNLDLRNSAEDKSQGGTPGQVRVLRSDGLTESRSNGFTEGRCESICLLLFI